MTPTPNEQSFSVTGYGPYKKLWIGSFSAYTFQAFTPEKPHNTLRLLDRLCECVADLRTCAMPKLEP